jgi:hypothetical protein
VVVDVDGVVAVRVSDRVGARAGIDVIVAVAAFDDVVAGALLIGFAAPAGAMSPPPKVGVGTLNCATAKGKVAFKPKLTATAVPTEAKVSFSLSDCTGSADGATVKSAKVKGTLSYSGGVNCAVATNFSSSQLTVTYHTLAHMPKLAPTTTSFNEIVLVHPNFSQVEVNGTATAGSFMSGSLFLAVGNAASADCHNAPSLTGTGQI